MGRRMNRKIIKMKYLLDTCTFLWLTGLPEKLSRRAVKLCEDPENEIYLSTISVWEISLKAALGRLKLATSPEIYVPQQRKAHRVQSLSLDETAPLILASLPDLHRDPFDRMLICQALSKNMKIITPDQHIHKYKIPVEW